MIEKVLAECISEALIKSKLHLVEHDMLKEYIATYKENKHLRELQKNMDKQYQELEEQLDNASKNYTKYIQERDNNWNELKEWLEKNVIDSKTTSGLNYYFRQVLNFMQEIESGKND